MCVASACRPAGSWLTIPRGTVGGFVRGPAPGGLVPWSPRRRATPEGPVITKPSLNDLLEGIAITAERVVQPRLEGSGADPVTPILMLVDRISAQWPAAGCCFIEANLDLELTLGRLEPLAGAAGPLDL